MRKIKHELAKEKYERNGMAKKSIYGILDVYSSFMVIEKETFFTLFILHITWENLGVSRSNPLHYISSLLHFTCSIFHTFDSISYMFQNLEISRKLGENNKLSVKDSKEENGKEAVFCSYSLTLEVTLEALHGNAFGWICSGM